MDEIGKFQQFIQKVNDVWLKFHLTARILLPLTFMLSIAMMIGGYSSVPITYNQEELIRRANPAVLERNIPYIQNNYTLAQGGQNFITDAFVDQYIGDTIVPKSVLQEVTDLTNTSAPANQSSNIMLTTLFTENINLMSSGFINLINSSFIVASTNDEMFQSKLEQAKINVVEYLFIHNSTSGLSNLYSANVNIAASNTIGQTITQLGALTPILESNYPTIDRIISLNNQRYVADATQQVTTSGLKSDFSAEASLYNTALISIVNNAEGEKTRLNSNLATSIGIGVSGTILMTIILAYGIWSFRVVKKKLKEQSI